MDKSKGEYVDRLAKLREKSREINERLADRYKERKEKEQKEKQEKESKEGKYG